MFPFSSVTASVAMAQSSSATAQLTLAHPLLDGPS